MLVEHHYIQAAEKISAEFHKEHDRLSRHSVNYTLKTKHKGIEIVFTIQFGYDDHGTVKCHLPLLTDRMGIEITTMHPIRQLFSLKKYPILLKSKSPKLKRHLVSLDSFYRLCCFAKRNRFEPIITGVNLEKSYYLKCSYHLLFERQDKVIELLYDFYCDLIDFLLLNQVEKKD